MAVTRHGILKFYSMGAIDFCKNKKQIITYYLQHTHYAQPNRNWDKTIFAPFPGETTTPAKHSNNTTARTLLPAVKRRFLMSCTVIIYVTNNLSHVPHPPPKKQQNAVEFRTSPSPVHCSEKENWGLRV